MGVIEFLVLAAVIGLIAWCLTQWIPMPPVMAKVIIAVAVLVVLLVLVRAVGLDTPIPRVR